MRQHPEGRCLARSALERAGSIAGQLLTMCPSCFLTARRISAEPESSTSRIARDRAIPPTIAANKRWYESTEYQKVGSVANVSSRWTIKLAAPHSLP
jgi:hypothetical protein